MTPWSENVERIREALLDTLASGVPAASIDPQALDALAALERMVQEEQDFLDACDATHASLEETRE